MNKNIKFYAFLFLILIVSCQKEEKDLIKEISFASKSLTIRLRDEVKLQVNHSPDNLPAPEYKWATSANGIVNISNDGTIKAVGLGETVITVSTAKGNLQSECLVKVVPVEASSIKLSADIINLKIEEDIKLKYEIEPENATYKEVTWTSNDNKIATVSTEGVVKAVSLGTTYINASLKYGINAVCTVNVNPIVSTSITLNTNSLTLEMTDKSILVATLMPENTTNKKIIWNSSDSSVATVSENGIVTGIDEGNCVITATTEDSGIKSECTVEVKIKGLKLSTNFINMLPDTEEKILVFNSLNNKEYNYATWTSSNPKVAIVEGVDNTNRAIIRSIGKGNATITASSEDIPAKKTSCDVYVSYSLKLSESALTMLPEEEEELSVYYLANNEKYISATWISSNPKVATVVGIDNTNRAIIKSKEAGTTTIIATSLDGTETAKCEINVKNLEDYISLDSNPQSGKTSGGFSTYEIGCTVHNTSNYLIHVDAVILLDESGHLVNQGYPLWSRYVQNGNIKFMFDKITLPCNMGNCTLLGKYRVLVQYSYNGKNYNALTNVNPNRFGGY